MSLRQDGYEVKQSANANALKAGINPIKGESKRGIFGWILQAASSQDRDGQRTLQLKKSRGHRAHSLLKITTTLSVTPHRSQFFQYDRITLACVANSSGWTVKRAVSSSADQECQHGWAIPSNSSCIIEDAYPEDSGEYWCESQRGERSNKVNITVTANSVILESPLHPVEEGENVTLRCFYKEDYNDESTSNFSARFYKDDVFIGRNIPGELTLKAEEGFYKCQHPSKGESQHSWVAMKGNGLKLELMLMEQMLEMMEKREDNEEEMEKSM
ncbi:uncharacterized protein LOC129351328 [Poeciliopsis prolifica]|uniref:uncharacterized protein LOC129351328 n=1 Tax=Poeciliopsis prolifica TaxID=188132 RepID=UPI00241405AF|nr:uncharacterized protein LOC129351328 [Poeciliopsis prolifica]